MATQKRNRLTSERMSLCGLLFLLVTISSYAAFEYAKKNASLDIARQGSASLALQTATFTSVFAKYQHLAALISGRPDVQEFFKDSNNLEASERASLAIEDITGLTGAYDTHLLASDGETLLSSRGFFSPSPQQRQDLISAPLQGRLGRNYVLGATEFTLVSNETLYIFTHGVRTQNSTTGIVAIAVGLGQLEETWALVPHPVYVVNSDGLFVVGNKISQNLLLGKKEHEQLVGLAQFSRDLPQVGWTLNILLPKQPILASSYNAGLLALLISTLFSIGVFVLLLRNQSARERARRGKEQSLKLELQVQDRTRALSLTNERLTAEVAERKQAEEALKKSQADLVQAAKLAALGQMSAGLSHEFNQPLAAIRSYADNAAIYLEKDRAGEAQGNIKQIASLVERMASISKHLRNFARKPQDKARPVNLIQAIEDACEIMSGKFKTQSTEIRFDMPQNEIWVMGGQVRLQQVFVNLLNNALDATNNLTEKRIVEIAVKSEEGKVQIGVRDFGQGIPEANSELIFDPFFTTKEVGSGLGLGLSISYNIIKDFEGLLTTSNHPDGGAVFIVELNEVVTASKKTLIEV